MTGLVKIADACLHVRWMCEVMKVVHGKWGTCSSRQNLPWVAIRRLQRSVSNLPLLCICRSRYTCQS